MHRLVLQIVLAHLVSIPLFSLQDYSLGASANDVI